MDLWKTYHTPFDLWPGAFSEKSAAGMTKAEGKPL
jgi:hypothetical protein